MDIKILKNSDDKKTVSKHVIDLDDWPIIIMAIVLAIVTINDCVEDCKRDEYKCAPEFACMEVEEDEWDCTPWP